MTTEPNHPTSSPPTAGSRILGYIRDCFLTGILVTAPVALSLYFVWSILKWVDNTVGEIIPLHLTGEGSIPGLGVVLAVSFLIIVGWFARNFIGLMFLNLSDYIMERLPFVKTIYSALKQVFEMLMGKQAQAFREVVMVEFPREGMWMMGFLTGKTDIGITKLEDQNFLNVFIPTTPNPTSGFWVALPAREVKRLDITVDEGLKAIVSCGLIMPKPPASKKSLTSQPTQAEQPPQS